MNSQQELFDSDEFVDRSTVRPSWGDEWLSDDDAWAHLHGFDHPARDGSAAAGGWGERRLFDGGAA